MNKSELLYPESKKLIKYKASDFPAKIVTTKHGKPVFLDDFGFLCYATSYMIDFPYVYYSEKKRIDYKQIKNIRFESVIKKMWDKS